MSKGKNMDIEETKPDLVISKTTTLTTNGAGTKIETTTESKTEVITEPKKGRGKSKKMEIEETKTTTKETSKSEIKVEETKITTVKENGKAKSKKVDIKVSDIFKTSGPEKRLERSFYKQNVVDLSKALLGKIVVRKTAEGVAKCRIVETEAYCGLIDKACHAYGGKKTDKTKWMYPEGGHVYVFSIYGNNYCLNITSGEEGDPSAVLIRATEPVDNLDLIKQWRGNPKTTSSGKELTNGPGKAGGAIKLDKSLNGFDLTTSDDIYLIEDNGEEIEVEISKRINIDYAGEDVDKPWRFYIKKNIFVSVK